MTDIWIRLLTEMEKTVSRPYFVTYFKDAGLLSYNNGILIIGVARPMYLQWHEHNTKDLFLEVAQKQGLTVTDVIFQVDSTLEGDKSRTVNLASHFPEKTKTRKLPGKQEVKTRDGLTSKILNPKYTLDSFIVGGNNQLAFAAATAVTKNLGTKFNPLFIYGGVGLGKTHLLQAIGNEVHALDPGKLVIYVTSETFTNEVVEAISKRNMNAFRRRYRFVDLLIIDDVQFFAGKDRTQEEFFHTFNALHEAGKQVIISSDRSPKELELIESRIVSRCEWGMTVDVKMPDYETRLAILYEKAKTYRSLISPDVFEFIAFNVHNSIRELEGVLMQVVAMIELENKTPTVEDVATAMKKLNKKIEFQGFNSHTPVLAKDMQTVCEFVSNHFNVMVSEITGAKRNREIMVPRQVSMYLCKQYLHLSLKKIGQFFGGRDHTSVMHAVKKLESLLKKDPLLKKDIEHLKQEMGV
ncbi:chromosomal replication initiator protein DnaA [Candidatus Peregrinibacteria bacterium]|nr:MAG: chromosomal replication initiator protein DnaA [Candidatus Peregrinibacteria bacterium]